MADENDQTTAPSTPAQPAEPYIGGPQEPAQAPRTVRVKYGGKELEVPEDVGQAWQEREREFSQKITQTGQELGELRKVRQEWEATKQAITGPKPAAEPDLDTLWYENPKQAAAMIESRVVDRVTSDYRRDQALRNFWDGFYRQADDLREDGHFVEYQFQRNFDSLANMPVPEAQAKLAELTRQEILRLTRKTSSPDPTTRRQVPLVEPASGDRPPRPARDADSDGPNSLSETIRARSAARRAARAAPTRGA